jgi:hypothetical protein
VMGLSSIEIVVSASLGAAWGCRLPGHFGLGTACRPPALGAIVPTARWMIRSWRHRAPCAAVPRDTQVAQRPAYFGVPWTAEGELLEVPV